MNGLLDEGYFDPVAEWLKTQKLGLLNQTRPVNSLVPQEPGIPATAPGMTPPFVPPQTQAPATPQGLLKQTDPTEEDKRSRWAMPLGMGLLNMGAGMMGGRWYPGYQDPPWVRGVQGLSQGVTQGMKMNREAQAEKYKQIQTLAALQKLYAEPVIMEYGGKKFIKQGDGKLVQVKEGTEGKPTDFDKKFAMWQKIAGNEDKTILDYEKEMGEAKGEGKPATTILDASGKPVGKVQGPVHVMPQSPQEKWKPERYVPEKGGPGVWIKPGDNVPEGYIPEKQQIAKASELDLTPESIDAMASRYMIDGTMPGLGLGKAATKARSMVMNRVAEKMKEEGITPPDLKTNQIVTAGLRSEATRLLGQRGPMLAFAKTADKNLDIALDLSGKVDRTGAPVINRWLLAGKKSIAGDPDVAAFHAATQVAINEFAKVTSSATGGGVTSDTARKEIEEVLSTAQNPEQFKAVVKTLRMDMGNRISGYEDSLNRLKEAAGQVGKTGGDTSKTKGGISTDAKYNRFKEVLSGPKAQQALEYAKKNDPEFVKRAQKEGLIP